MSDEGQARGQAMRKKSAVVGILVAIVGVVITQVVSESRQNNPFCWDHVGWWRIGCAMAILGVYGGLAAVPVIWKFDVEGPSLRRIATFVFAPFAFFGVAFVLIADGCN